MCDINRALIPFVCWLYRNALRLILFQNELFQSQIRIYTYLPTWHRSHALPKIESYCFHFEHIVLKFGGCVIQKLFLNTTMHFHLFEVHEFVFACLSWTELGSEDRVTDAVLGLRESKGSQSMEESIGGTADSQSQCSWRRCGAGAGCLPPAAAPAQPVCRCRPWAFERPPALALSRSVVLETVYACGHTKHS